MQPKDIALNFCLKNELIDKVIIGIENASQLEEICKIKKIDFEYEEEMFTNYDEKLLNPSNWRI